MSDIILKGHKLIQNQIKSEFSRGMGFPKMVVCVTSQASDLLCGDKTLTFVQNKQIFKAVQEFIIKSKRFEHTH